MCRPSWPPGYGCWAPATVGSPTRPTRIRFVMAALRTRGLRQLAAGEVLVVLRLLADRRDELARGRVQTVNRGHRLLAELIPGGAPRDLSALQATALLAGVRPRDAVGRTRRAGRRADRAGRGHRRQAQALKLRLAQAVTAAGSGLMDLYDVGPAGAARILADVGDMTRFPDRCHFASWIGRLTEVCLSVPGSAQARWVACWFCGAGVRRSVDLGLLAGP
jgi:transposase